MYSPRDEVRRLGWARVLSGWAAFVLGWGTVGLLLFAVALIAYHGLF